MLIGGLQKTSLTDYPGKVSAIIYTQGCNFRCPFCYNPELVDSRFTTHETRYTEVEVLDFLRSRRGKLDAVVITGGEPTIQEDLPVFINKIKEMPGHPTVSGFLVGLYTNGTNPEMLAQLLGEELVDYISMDVKSQLSIINYQLSTGIKMTDGDLERIRTSLELLMKSDIDYRIATTVVPGLVTIKDLVALAPQIRGVKRFVLQSLVKSEKMLDNRYKDVEPYPTEELEKLRAEIAGYFGECEVRS